MKRKREEDEYGEPVQDVEYGVAYQESDSQLGSQLFGSQEFFAQDPESPFSFTFDESQSPSLPESPSGSQSPIGSQLTEDVFAFVLRQLDEFIGESQMNIETELQPHIEQYTDALKGHNEASIEYALKIPASVEPVTTSPTTPLDQIGALDAPVSLTTRDEIVVEEAREKVGEVAEAEVAEAEGAEEVDLDEGTSLYISKAAEKIFDDALKEFIDDEIQEAADSLPEIEYSLQDLRMEILYDPKFKDEMAQVRSQNLEDLKSEIWRLLQQEETSVED
jgi:hypothetical protein